jgi:hypothetical protein
MFVHRPGEHASEAERRRVREEQAAREHIKAIDAASIPNEAQEIAFTQLNNAERGRPLDYAAIMRGRATRPEFFLNLPSDIECRKALGLPEPTEDERREILKTRIAKK